MHKNADVGPATARLVWRSLLRWETARLQAADSAMMTVIRKRQAISGVKMCASFTKGRMLWNKWSRMRPGAPLGAPGHRLRLAGVGKLWLEDGGANQFWGRRKKKRWSTDRLEWLEDARLASTCKNRVCGQMVYLR